MQDRFKFRVFLKNENKLVYPEEITFLGTGKNGLVYQISIIYKEDDKNIEQTYDIDDVIISQPTGLKDKNGKLIYEGDLHVDNYKRPSIVQRNALGLELYCKPSHIPGYHFNKFFPIDNMEVIGNIYENPELLETQT